MKNAATYFKIAAFQVPPRGLEQPDESSRKTGAYDQYGAVGTQEDLNDPELPALIEAWPPLNEGTKASIREIVWKSLPGE